MKQILLIEPDYLLAQTYASAIKRFGYQVSTCASGQAAIFAIDASRPDLILLELKLAGHSGFEFLYELRSYAEWQDIPVVILSGLPANELSGGENVLAQLGVKRFYYKPKTTLAQLAKSIKAELRT